ARVMRIRDENKEAAIRLKALEMIVNDGFDGLSMQKLAKAADVSPATIYIYFKDREDLIVQLWVSEANRMAEASLKGFDPSMSFEEGLRVQWMNRARFAIENQLSTHFMEQIKYSPYESICRTKMNPTFLDAMRSFAHNAIKRKELTPLPVEVFWSIAYAPLYQLVKMHMAGRGFPGNEKFSLDEKIMNQTLQLVLKALKP
ncbi:MAG: TetR/AcrR family transcriptional regulator, partial [Bacteroidota bacterium]